MAKKKRPVGKARTGSIDRGIQRFRSGKKEANLKFRVGKKGLGPKGDTVARDPAQVSDFNDADRSAMEGAFMDKPMPEEQPVSANAMEDAEKASQAAATEGVQEAVQQLLRRRVTTKTEEEYHIPGEVSQPQNVPPAKAQAPSEKEKSIDTDMPPKDGGKPKLAPDDSAMSAAMKKKKRKVKSSVSGGY